MLLTDHLRFGTVYFRNQEYSPALLDAGVRECAEWINHKVSPNAPFIHLHFRNHIKCMIAYLAIIKSGHVCVMISPRIGPLEYDELLADTAPGAIIRINPKTIPFDYGTECTVRPDPAPWCDELTYVCTIMYTAADDGYYKGAMLTHGNMLANARSIAEGNGVDAASVSCALISMEHLFALQTGFLAPMINAGETVLAEVTGELHVHALLDHLQAHGVSHLYSVPVMYYLMGKEHGCRESAISIRSAISGGCPLFERAAKVFLSASGHEIREGYGLTEASPVCTWNFPDQPARAGSVGRPISCCTVFIHNGNGAHLPHKTSGDICIKGSNVMKGYYHNARATAHVLNGDILYTKDRGYIDEEGYLYFTDSKKDMANFTGEKIYPRYYERLIGTNPAVDRITITKTPHPLFYEEVKVQVRLKMDSPENRKAFELWCETSLSRHKLPAKFEYACL